MSWLPPTLVLGVLTLTAFPACTIPFSKTQTGRSNGGEHLLFFSSAPAEADLGIVPIGTTRTISVYRLPGGDIDCTMTFGQRLRASSHEGKAVRPLGGGKPDIGDEDCTAPIGADPLELESASCDDGACAIDSEPRESGITLRIRSDRASSSRLRVKVKSTKDGAVYEDWLAVAFAKAERIEVVGSSTGMEALRGSPVLPGTRIALHRVAVVDARGTVMSLDADALTERIEDESVLASAEPTRGDDDRVARNLEARASGRTKVTWAVEGLLARSADVEVVAAEEATAIEVDGTTRGHTRPNGVLEIQEASLDDATPARGAPRTTLEATSPSAYDAVSTHIVLVDGRRALGALASAKVAPADLDAFVAIAPYDATVVRLQTFPKPGDATLSLTVEGGTAKATIPLLIRARN